MATNLEDEIARRAFEAVNPRSWESANQSTREHWWLVARTALVVVDEAADARAKGGTAVSREEFAKMLHDIWRSAMGEYAKDWADWTNMPAVDHAAWNHLAAAIERLYENAKRLTPIATPAADPIPMLLWCPGCGERHIDRALANKPHHTHACQHCGMVWRPAKIPTVGVDFLPGYKDAPREEDAGDRAQTRTVTRCRAWSYPGHTSWSCELYGKPDGRQCALDANHQGNHELVGPWTRDTYPTVKR